MFGDLNPLEWTEEHERTLRALTVDENRPGTIRRDFGTMLAFFRERDLPVSRNNQLPPLKILPQLNALMSQPIEVRLKRPQLKSYPHLEGLYLLLRASGLGQIGGAPSKPVLVIDEELYSAWSALNPTEQYFNLLEIWLLHAPAGIVGERSSSFDFPVRSLASLVALVQQATAQGLPVANDWRAEGLWLYSPGRMGFALLELFGLLSVVNGSPQEGEGWVVERVHSTPLGEAVFALLNTRWLGDFDRMVELEEALEESASVLQPIFAPYVPQWQHTLERPSWSFREGRYVFKVVLGRGLWRRIAIDAEEPLDTLASEILSAYKFDHDHLYEFFYRDPLGVEESVKHPYIDEGPWADEVRVGDMPLLVGQTMVYLFDFGDQWRFNVTLERIDPPGKSPREPAVVDARGEAPEQYPRWDE
jgi:hypothetical protein